MFALRRSIERKNNETKKEMKSGCRETIWNVQQKKNPAYTYAQRVQTFASFDSIQLLFLLLQLPFCCFFLSKFYPFSCVYTHRLHLPGRVQISVQHSFYSFHIHHCKCLFKELKEKKEEHDCNLGSIVLIEKKISFHWISMSTQRFSSAQNDLLFASLSKDTK